MRQFLTILFFFFSLSLRANNYYFSTANGDDSRTSVQAQNPATPWKTIAKLNSFFPSLAAGDFIYFNRGEIYPGSLNITKSGLDDLPITIDAYGTGAKPEFSALTALTAWTSVGTNLWETSFNAGPYGGALAGYPNNLGYYLNTVVYNNRMIAMGRWPNAGYRFSSSTSTRGNFVDASLSFATNQLVGAELVYKPTGTPWVIDRGDITANTATTITYIPSTQYSAALPGAPLPGGGNAPSWGYFIQGFRESLDQQNEWWYDKDNLKLRVYSVGTPSGISASAHDNLINANGQSYVQIRNIMLRGADVYGINLVNCTGFLIQGCEVYIAGRGSINFDGCQYTTIAYNIMDQAGSFGYYGRQYYGSTETNNSDIHHNTVKAIGLIPGMGWSNEDQYIAGYAFGTNTTIWNDIDSIGGSGIKARGEGSVCSYNHIRNFSLTIQDNGGIYMHDFVNTWREVAYNVVYNGRGNIEGTFNLGLGGDGIYLDDVTNKVNVHHNSVFNNSHTGFFFHNNEDINVYQNITWNNGDFECYTLDQPNATPELWRHRFTNNIFFSDRRVGNYDQNNFLYQAEVYDYSTAANKNPIARNWNWYIDSNIYARPFLPFGAIEWTSGGYTKRFWNDPAALRASTPAWENNNVAGPRLAPYTVTSVGVNAFLNSGFNTDIFGVTAPTSETVVSWTNTAGLDAGAVRVQIGSGNAREVWITLGNLTGFQKYRIRFDARAETNQLGNILGQLPGDKTFFPLTTTRASNEWIFTAPYSGGFTLSLLMYENTGEFFLDNFTLTPVTAVGNNILDSVRYEYNATASPKTVNFSGSTYKDLRGTSYANSVILQPMTSTILMLAGGAPANIPPTVNAGTDRAIQLPTATTTGNGTASDPDGTVTVLWNQVSGPNAAGISAPTALATNFTGLIAGDYFMQLTATDNLGATARDTMKITVSPATNQLPTVNAGPDYDSLQAPTSSVTITGTANDPDGTFTSLWTQEFGPSTVSISAPTLLTTTVSGLIVGTYYMRLTVTDNAGGTATDLIRIIVRAANRIPGVAAGDDKDIQLPVNSVSTTGSANDLDGSIASVLWNQVSGPNTAGISAATSYTTNFTGLIAGTYRFRLGATDNQGATGYDTMSVVVRPANTPPLANAGNDTSITLPTNAVTLNGSGSDIEGPVTFTWTKIAGPAAFAIGSSTSQSTLAYSLVQGSYTFRLTVTDSNGVTATDNVIITVNAATAVQSATIKIPGRRKWEVAQ